MNVPLWDVEYKWSLSTAALRGENCSISISSPSRDRPCVSVCTTAAERTLVPEQALQLAWQGSQVRCAASW